MRKKLIIDVSHWVADASLKTISYSARGVLSMLMPYANNDTGYGTLHNNGTPLSRMELSLLLSGNPVEIEDSISELFKKEILVQRSRSIEIPFMVEAERKASIYRNNGSKGGNPALTDRVDEDGVPFYITKKGKRLEGPQYKAFMAFWNTFNYKKGKAEAADAWLKLQVNRDMVIGILKGAKKEDQLREDKLDRGITPIYPEGWLSGRRWEDE